MTEKHEKVAFWVILTTIVLLVAAFMYCAPAHAAEKDAAFYQRTGTKPPGMGGEFFVPISARYIQDLGLGVGVGYRWKASGIMLSGQITYDRFNAINGTVPFVAGGQCYTVPYAIPSSGHRGVELTVAFPIRKR